MHDPIVHYNFLAGMVINQYFNNTNEIKHTNLLCTTIEPVVMIQRMLSKAMEIHCNNIVVKEYSIKNGLTAIVTSMAVVDYVESILGSVDSGYNITKGVLSAAHFGAPQKRMRFVIMGIKKCIAKSISLPEGRFSEKQFRTVKDAIKDIDNIKVATTVKDGSIGIELPVIEEPISELGQQLRNSKILYNHVSTETTPHALERFKKIQQGCNFHDLPLELKTTYSDSSRTQNTIYLRLKYNEPSGTVVNVRKSMWIHPIHDRALSIREAARLQTFPDSFVFYGVKDSQYQQIGNAVDMKSPQSIFIVGSGKDDRTFHLHMLKHFKSRTVCQMNIHKHKFRHRMGLKPFDGIHNAVCLSDNFQPGRNFVNNGLQITQGSLFVFYNQCFHISGSLTMKQLFSSFTTISCLNSSR